MAVEQFELNPNGKLDMKKLPEVEWGRVGGQEGAGPDEPRVGPRNDVEQNVHDQWVSTLQAPGDLSVFDDFFRIGGNSMKAIIVAAALKREFALAGMSTAAMIACTSIASTAELIQATLAEMASGAAVEARAPTPLAWSGPYRPLSSGQQQMLILSSQDATGCQYNSSTAYEVRGSLDVAVLQQALAAVIGRHEVLRSAFTRSTEGELRMEVLPAAAGVLPIVTSSLSDDDALSKWMHTALHMRIDLHSPPLGWVGVATLPGKRSVLLITFHHSVMDGWSQGLLMRELLAAYKAVKAGGSPKLEPLPLTYADYAEWQAKAATGESAQKQLAWWKAKLAGAPEVLQLPTDRPRPAVWSRIGAHFEFEVDEALVGSLKAFASSTGTTPFIALLAAFRVLLARTTGQDDFCLGAAYQNRPSGTEELIGYFINTLPLRTSVDRDVSFVDLAAAEQVTLRQAMAHSDVSFATVVQALNVARTASYSPLIQTMMVYQDEGFVSEDVPAGADSMAIMPAFANVAHMDITLMFMPRSSGAMTALCQYNVDIFDACTMEGLVTSFKHVLSQLVAAPAAPVGGCELLSPAQRTAILVGSLQGPCHPEYLSQPPAVMMFEQLAASQPAATCLVAGDATMVYGDVNLAAAALCARLVAVGAPRGSSVGVLLNRGFDLVVSILAIWKAGCVYVPMDPEFPEDRLAIYAEDSHASALLCAKETMAKAQLLSVADGTKIVVVDVPASNPKGAPVEAGARLAATPEDVAYCIFTSGSTGRPKGVLVSHLCLTDLTCHYRDRFAAGPNMVAMLVTSISFDPHLLDISVTLTSGGCLVLPKPGGQMEPPYIADLIKEHRVSCMLTGVPSLAREYLAALGTCDHIRLWSMGGEPMPAALANAMQKAFPNMVGPINAYGPTEATIIATGYECPRPCSSQMYIGAPDNNMHAYVVDPLTRQLVPLGVSGELLLSGPRLALGYYGRPDLTDAAFISNPFYEEVASSLPAAMHPYYKRMYRTGDLVRWSPEGLLEYLGRIDRQVKVNGVRIELGEVEAALEGAPGVRGAMAQVRKDTTGRASLVGYCLMAKSGTAAVLEHCSKVLLPTMVPSVIVALEAFPLLPNGKIDTKALPEPDWGNLCDEEFVAPSKEYEAQLQALWGAELGISEPISVQSDWYRIGGTSLKAIALASKLKETFALPGSTAALLQLNTIAEQAEHVSKDLASGAGANNGARQQIVATTWVDSLRPPSVGQLSMFALGKDQTSSHYNEGIKYVITGDVDAYAMQQALNAFAMRHETLHSAFTSMSITEAAGPKLRVWKDVMVPLQVEDLTHGGRSAGEVQAATNALVMSSQTQPFDMTQAPMMRALLVKTSPKSANTGHATFVFLAVLHHAIMDGWSMGLLGGEVSAFYNNIKAGRHPAEYTMAPLELQYSDFAVWQKSFLDGAAAQEKREFWKREMAGAPPLLKLPLDKPRPEKQSYKGKGLDGPMPRDVVESVHHLNKACGSSMFTTFLAAFKATLSLYSGQEDVVVGSPFATRPPGTHGMMGYFLNMLPVRSKVVRSMTFRQLLAQERTALQDTTLTLAKQHSINNKRQPLPLLPTHSIERMRDSMVGLMRAACESPDTPMCELDVMGAGERALLLRAFQASPKPGSWLEALSAGAGGDAPLQAYVVDPVSLQLAPIGVLGELLLAGPALPRQFARCPTVPNPFFADVSPIVGAMRASIQRTGSRAAAVPAGAEQLPVRQLYPAGSHGASTALPPSLADDPAAPYKACVRTGRLAVWSGTGVLTEVGALEPLVSASTSLYTGVVEGTRDGGPGSVLDYWKAALADSPVTVSFSMDRPYPAARSGRTGLTRLTLGDATATALSQLATELHVHPLMVLLAGFYTMLGRFTRQDDMLVACAYDGSPPAGSLLDGLIVKGTIETDPSFRRLVGELHRAVRGGLAHPCVTHTDIARAMDVTSNSRYNTLVQAAIAMDGADLLDAPGAASNYDLVLGSAGGTFRLALKYNSDVFEAATIERMAHALSCICDAVAVNPDAKVKSLPLLDADAVVTVLKTFNCSYDATNFQAPPFHAMFEAQAAQLGSATACILDGTKVSYADLNAKANRLAHHLVAAGVKANCVVGLMVDRCFDLPVGILAIHKAGGCYVPLDGGYPEDRLAGMLQDAGARFMVTTSMYMERAGRMLSGVGMAECPVLDMDVFFKSQASDYPDTNVAVARSGPQDLAYILFTSGSTGRPKGVMIRHISLTDYCNQTMKQYALGRADVAFVTSTVSFDAHVICLHVPLIAGASTVLAAPGQHLNPDYVANVLSKHDVSFYFTVPTLWTTYMQSKFMTGLTRLKLMIGGETVTMELINKTMAAHPATTVYNVYGPTETTVYATAGLCMRGAAVFPIGPPHDNMHAYIVDDDLNIVPAGVPGELLLCGPRVAKGYVGRDDLTADKFITNKYMGTIEAFTPHPEQYASVYRTGDLTRWLPDGSLEFLGRIDRQVKINGVRMELGEIESVMTQVPCVKQSMTKVLKDQLGVTRLVGYVIPGDVAPSDVITHCKSKLVPAMVPSVVIAMEEFPVGTTGKTDVKLLPTPDWTVQLSEAEYIAPRDAVEQTIQQVWMDSLDKRDPISIHADFFSAGGTSLNSIMVASRVSEMFNLGAKGTGLHKYTTIIDLADYLRSSAPVDELMGALQGQEGRGIPVVEWPVGDPLRPLTYSQLQMYTLWLNDPDSGQYNEAVTLKMEGGLDSAVLLQALNMILDRHDVLRCSFETGSVGPIMRQHPKGSVKMPFREQDVDTSLETCQDNIQLTHNLHKLLSPEGLKPFDFAEVPLARAVVYHLHPVGHPDKVYHVLQLSMHHAVIDGWSMGVLVNDFAEMYNAVKQAREPKLKELPVQYPDFAQWQKNWASSETATNAGHYWQDKLHGAPTIIDWPADKVRPDVPTNMGGDVMFTVSGEACQGMRAITKRAQASAFMVVLAAYGVMLCRWTKAETTLVGSSYANRRPDTRNLIGYFLNILPLRMDVSKGQTFYDLVAQVRDTVKESLSNADVPFQRIVQLVNAERAPGVLPLIQAGITLDEKGWFPEIKMDGVTGCVVSTVPIKPFFSLSHFRLATWTLSSAACCAEPIMAHLGNTKMDLMIGFQPPSDSDPHMLCGMQYNVDLFQRSTAESMCASLKAVIEAAFTHPDTPVLNLPLMTPQDRVMILNNFQGRWDPSHFALPPLHHQFEAAAARAPAAVATIDHTGTRLTYGALNVKANKLARHLISLGVGPDVPVGIMVERGHDLIVSMLATMKAGGAYLPLDPSYPDDRLAVMTEDAKASVVISHADNLGRAKDMMFAAGVTSGVSFVCLEDFWANAAPSLPGANPGPRAGPTNSVYVIFTSGSTGRPKGVVIRHECLSDHVGSNAKTYQMTPRDVSILTISINFDPHAMQVWTALAVGATVSLPKPDGHTDPGHLVEVVLAHKVTWWVNVPSILQLFVKDPRAATCTSLRCFTLGGEALLPEAVDQIKDRLPGADVYNVYGPTEATIVATRFGPIASVFQHPTSTPNFDTQLRHPTSTPNFDTQLRHPTSTPNFDTQLRHVNTQHPTFNTPLRGTTRVTIGRPEDNMGAYVVDENMQLLPVGLPGQLLLTGPRTATGYIGRDDLTVTKFVPNPFLDELLLSAVPEEEARRHYGRVYQSGDLVRWTHDGQITFMGRIDRQTKINGVRIELEEVENVVRVGPGVEQAVVKVHQDPARGNVKMLVAYVVPGSVVAKDVREHCQGKLAGAMVPSIFRVMDEFPKLPNGKVNMHLLHPLPVAPPEVVPRRELNQIEYAVQKIFTEELKLESPVDPAADFFELGGTSLLAGAVSSRIRSEAPLKLSMFPATVIFNSRTVENVAACIMAKYPENAAVKVVLESMATASPQPDMPTPAPPATNIPPTLTIGAGDLPPGRSDTSDVAAWERLTEEARRRLKYFGEEDARSRKEVHQSGPLTVSPTCMPPMLSNVMQFLTLLLSYAVIPLYTIGCFVPAFILLQLVGAWKLIPIIVGLVLVNGVIMAFICIAGKWLLLGRQQPGCHSHRERYRYRELCTADLDRLFLVIIEEIPFGGG
ncbi:hypothetical protein FOA52_005066 [Chlamydomonas sp. UWO 241]|nr:hypothetical protein FOA52_005066 [Chlamydomonas sp. UWO 241]